MKHFRPRCYLKVVNYVIIPTPWSIILQKPTKVSLWVKLSFLRNVFRSRFRNNKWDSKIYCLRLSIS